MSRPFRFNRDQIEVIKMRSDKHISLGRSMDPMLDTQVFLVAAARRAAQGGVPLEQLCARFDLTAEALYEKLLGVKKAKTLPKKD